MQPHLDLEKALAAFPEKKYGSREHIDLLLELAWEIALLDLDRSAALTAEARALAKKIDYQEAIAYCLRNEGYHLSVASQLREALPLLTEAIELFKENDDKLGVATTQDTLSFTHWRLGDYDKAHDLALQSLKLNQEIGNKRGEAWALHNIAGISNETEDTETAIRYYREALKIFDHIGYKAGISRVLSCLGNCYYQIGDLQQALACNMESRKTCQETQLSLGAAGAQIAIGRILSDLNDPKGAEECFRDALHIMDSLESKEAKANARYRYAEFLIKQNRESEGLQLFDEALELIEKTDARPATMRIHEALYHYYEKKDDLRNTLKHYKKFRELKEAINSERSREKLRNLQILRDLERAEQEAEINRLKYTELAEMQAQLIQSERLALLGNLVAGIAHEVNTPLGIINSSSDTARRALDKIDGMIEANGNGVLQKTLNLLRDNTSATVSASSKIAQLVKRLQNFASLDAAEEQVIDIRQSLLDTVALIQPKLPDSIKIVTDLPEVPKIRCYPQALNQVFMTLIQNAVEAIDGIGIISVSVSAENDSIVILISDTGRGIPAEQLESIFDVGFSHKNQTVRMNVGMANAYNIVQKHNGEMSVTSKVGHGSQFTIRLPVNK